MILHHRTLNDVLTEYSFSHTTWVLSVHFYELYFRSISINKV